MGVCAPNNINNNNQEKEERPTANEGQVQSQRPHRAAAASGDPCSSMQNLVSIEKKAVEPPPAKAVGEHGSKYANGLIFVLDKVRKRVEHLLGRS